MTNETQNSKDIEAMLSMLKPEVLAKVLSSVNFNRRMHKIDYSHKLRRIRTNDLYFNSAISPHHVDDFDAYNMHDEGIRQQALSGVDL